MIPLPSSRYLSVLSLAVVTSASALFLAGCGKEDAPVAISTAAPVAAGPAPLFLSITSDMDSNPQSVDMAMKLAGFALDEERAVFLFFNVKGVNVPVQSLPEDALFGAGPPIREQLAKLIERGAQVHACPICMKALGVEADTLLDGVEVTTRPALFAKISPDTAVFTY